MIGFQDLAPASSRAVLSPSVSPSATAAVREPAATLQSQEPTSNEKPHASRRANGHRHKITGWPAREQEHLSR